jgi:hypothetical protein
VALLFLRLCALGFKRRSEAFEVQIGADQWRTAQRAQDAAAPLSTEWVG